MSVAGWGAITIALLLCLLTWYYYEYFKLKKSLKTVKGPFPVPFLGNVLSLQGRNSILPTLSTIFQKYGKNIIFMVAAQPILMIADHDAVMNALGSTTLLDKSFVYKFLHNWLNGGLLVSTGKKWKQRRRILTPSYHFQILEQFVPIFNRVADILVDQFKKEKNKDAVDIYPYVTLSTLDVICETAMGVSVNAQLNEHSSYVHSVKELGKIVIDRAYNVLQQFDITYKFTDNYKKEMKSLQIVHDYTDFVIKCRREELAKNQLEDVRNQDDIGAKKRIAFLDMLLQAKDENGLQLTDADICEEVDTFMFEGHDTAASGISFALYEISNNPDVQKKILEEQYEILQGENRDFTYNDLNQMKYLDMVIKETLRMYPSVPIYGRQTSEEFQLTESIKVPADCTIAIMAYHIHHDPDYYPEPHKFNPDRFHAENNLGKKPYSFVPFSAGPRNCIGQKFAFLEMKSTLSKMVRHFVLSPTAPLHKLDLAAETILKSDNGILIKIKERV